jgi:hypothetical protein
MDMNTVVLVALKMAALAEVVLKAAHLLALHRE